MLASLAMVHPSFIGRAPHAADDLEVAFARDKDRLVGAIPRRCLKARWLRLPEPLKAPGEDL
jgi:hypothetical protein